MKIRPATASDSAELASLLNEIIAVGGTTAHEDPLTEQHMRDHYVSAKEKISCFVAERGGSLLGFQSLARPYESDENYDQSWGLIATFVKIGAVGGGIGSALFAQTVAAGRSAGLSAIDATIRADNQSGLRFYAKMGFVDYKVLKSMPLADGTLLDRICKRWDF